MGLATSGLRWAFAALAAWASLTLAARAESQPSAPQAAQPTDIAAFNFPPLTPGALRAHIETLASDRFEGRAPATRGEDLTVDYISRAFAAAGLAPGGDPSGPHERSWTQRVPLVLATLLAPPSLSVSGAGGAQTLSYGDDFVAWTRAGAPHVALDRAPLVFVGYGLAAPQLGWQNYAGVDMHGKIALILANDPDWRTGDDRGFRGAEMSNFGRTAYKLEEAARQGAVGAFIIHDEAATGFPWDAARTSWSGPQIDIARDNEGTTHPRFEGWLTHEAARQLMARAGLDLEAEELRATRPDFTPRPLGLTASLRLDARFDEIVSHNVVGVLGGRARYDEAVLFSAHWDHLGLCPPVNGDSICNGALDNASGVAGLIELARRFASAGRTQRSIVFLATTAEEAGMLGSQYFVSHPNIPPARIAGAFNLDIMSNLGPAHDITIYGAGRNDLDSLLDQVAARHGRRVSPDAFPEFGAFFRSDQLSFAEAGVPVLFAGAGLDLYDGGPTRGRALAQAYLAERYHKPSDEITPRWDLTGAFQDLLLLFEAGQALANSDVWPEWRAGAEFKSVRDASRRARMQ